MKSTLHQSPQMQHSFPLPPGTYPQKSWETYAFSASCSNFTYKSLLSSKIVKNILHFYILLLVFLARAIQVFLRAGYNLRLYFHFTLTVDYAKQFKINVRI